MLKGSPSTYKFVLASSLRRSIRDLKESPSITDEDDGDRETCVPEGVSDA
jgi:hypothetical protein